MAKSSSLHKQLLRYYFFSLFACTRNPVYATPKINDNFIKDKENLKETARKEIQLEVATVKKDRDVEIEKIYERVQQAIVKKDAAIELLHKDNAALKERCIKLEALIRQQRKDYFIK